MAEKKYTGREICRILNIAYPSFQQYVHYWKLKPVGETETRAKLYSEKTLNFLKARRQIWRIRDSKYKSWFKASEVMPEIDSEYSQVIGYPVSKLCEIREYNKSSKARFNFITNKWVNQETLYSLNVTIWKYAEVEKA